MHDLELNAEPIRAERLVPVSLGGAERAALSARTPHSVSIAWFGTSLRLALDDPAAAEALRRRYRAFAAKAAHAEVSVWAARDAGGARFAVSDGAAYRWNGPLHSRGLEFLCDAVAGEAYFVRHTSHVSFHAATVALGDAAAAITAASEGGKTTTTIACARRGFEIFSDEWCVLDGIQTLPFPRALNVRPGALALLARELPEHPISRAAGARAGAKWRDVAFEEIFGAWSQPRPRPLRAIFFIVGHGPHPAIAPLAAADALERLLASAFRCRVRGEAISRAMTVLGAARPYALTLGSPDASALAIAATLRTVAAAA